MQLQQVLETRRSIRHYDAERIVTKEQIEQLIEAATLAPSWKNSQTARYYCILSEEGKEAFRKNCLPSFNANNCAGAGALIVTSFVQNRSGYERNAEPSNEVGNGWGFYDLGLHNENLLLKAADLGLGTLVMGIRDEEEIRKMLSVPAEERICSVIAVGYAAAPATMPKRKDVAEIAAFY